MGVVKKRLKRTIGVALTPFGLSVPRVSVPAATRLNSPLEAVYSQKDVIFEVPVEKCVANYQFSFGPRGWHPFVKTLRQWAGDSSLTYADSLLFRYYEEHRPRRLWDVFFERAGEDDPLHESGLKTVCADAYLAPNPWEERLNRIRGEGPFNSSHGVQVHGPVSTAKGEWEFLRLVGVYRSIQSKGYRPTSDSDGEIRGYFLRMGGDYRFFVRAGLHRMAALAALDYARVRVKFKANFPRAVDLADIEHWPLVRNGFIEKPVATRIFCRYFTDDGTGKAQNLGLLSS